MPLQDLIDAQGRWANLRWPGHVGVRAPSLEDNLIMNLSKAIKDDLLEGDGNEIGTAAQPGKMWSLRSSSALAYNVFAPWYGRDLNPLSTALGVRLSDFSIRFERKFNHGLPPPVPNLDVVLDNEQVRPLAIECKFTEPYGNKKKDPPLKAAYFLNARKRWNEVQLPRCQRLAESLGNDSAFRRFSAGQLLKHILGIATETKHSPRLLYLWFDTGCQEALAHTDELVRFAQSIDDAVDFKALTYQEIFGRLRSSDQPVPGYFHYLTNRYFG
jgi:hypothetical protein